MSKDKILKSTKRCKSTSTYRKFVFKCQKKLHHAGKHVWILRWGHGDAFVSKTLNIFPKSGCYSKLKVRYRGRSIIFHCSRRNHHGGYHQSTITW